MGLSENPALFNTSFFLRTLPIATLSSSSFSTTRIPPSALRAYPVGRPDFNFHPAPSEEFTALLNAQEIYLQARVAAASQVQSSLNLFGWLHDWEFGLLCVGLGFRIRARVTSLNMPSPGTRKPATQANHLHHTPPAFGPARNTLSCSTCS